jgi:hypothetical protein
MKLNRLAIVAAIALMPSGYAQADGDTRSHPVANGRNNAANHVGRAGGFGQGGAGGSGGAGGFGQGGNATSMSNAVVNARTSSRANSSSNSTAVADPRTNSTSNSGVTLDSGAIGNGGNNVMPTPRQDLHCHLLAVDNAV